MKDLRGLEGIAKVEAEFIDRKESLVHLTMAKPVEHAAVAAIVNTKQWKLLDTEWRPAPAK